MGNCQAIDAAALVIQHPSGRLDRLYWSVTVSEVMRNNPGHYVSLIIPLPSSVGQDNAEKGDGHHRDKKPVRFTRVKLLRPNETLELGHAYRLVTSQEVMKVLKAKKYAKAKGQRPESMEKPSLAHDHDVDNGGGCKQAEQSDIINEDDKTSLEETSHESNQGRQRPRLAPVNSTAGRPKSWRPTLQSIAEVSS